MTSPLAKFYRSLVKSEGEHGEDYLALAHQVSVDRDVQPRIAFFAAREAEPISEPDSDFRFHSDVPVQGRRAISGART
ncbi:MAG TPA: tRNA isopentenyl-2-thiomethyl-A-37 hydroxylase MiaE [Halomonas sp.]|nr:tRNA isopentenyl-2-thiomethyl-A-37 hydroxylase MiaE [Halomonas sp.]